MIAATQVADQLAHIAVIGAGMAGRSFTSHLLARGLTVTLEDVLPSNLRRAEDELNDAQFPDDVAGRLNLASTVEDAVRSADLAIDFVPDELESKLEILSMIDRMAPPRTILLTPTDVLSISDLASCTYRPERCFGLSGVSRSQPLPKSASVSLLHPLSSSPRALASVEDLLRSLHFSFTTRPDPHPTLLVCGR